MPSQVPGGGVLSQKLYTSAMKVPCRPNMGIHFPMGVPPPPRGQAETETEACSLHETVFRRIKAVPPQEGYDMISAQAEI